MKAIIDGDSLVYLSLPKKANPEATYETCLQEMQSRIHEILINTKANEYIIGLTINRCFRYRNWNYSEDYKHKRKNSKHPPIYYALREYLKQNYNCIYIDGLEADDIVCTYYTECRKAGMNVTLCSTDKDVIFQVSGIHYNYAKKEFIKVTASEATYFLYKQVLMGDTTDNISGIKGVGEKTVDKLFYKKNIKQLPSIALNKYLDIYPHHEAINRFLETFKMVYILKSYKEVMREIGVEMELPKFEKIEYEGNKEIW